MKITIVCASNRQPAWIRAGFDHYAQRLRGSLKLELDEIRLERRPAGDVDRAVADEGERMLARVPAGAHAVALDEVGEHWSTRVLAARLDAWIRAGRPVIVLIGGPDGLSKACRDRAAERWALSALTLPHGLARVVVAEALYRAWTVLERHPYHRA